MKKNFKNPLTQKIQSESYSLFPGGSPEGGRKSEMGRICVWSCMLGDRPSSGLLTGLIFTRACGRCEMEAAMMAVTDVCQYRWPDTAAELPGCMILVAH